MAEKGGKKKNSWCTTTYEFRDNGRPLLAGTTFAIFPTLPFDCSMRAGIGTRRYFCTRLGDLFRYVRVSEPRLRGLDSSDFKELRDIFDILTQPYSITSCMGVLPYLRCSLCDTTSA